MEEQKWVKAVRKEWWHHEKTSERSTETTPIILFWTDVLLIELVKHKPLLYDFSSPQYSDVPAKNSAWKEIGNVMNTSAARCRTRWERLRSQHRKKINRIKTTDTKLRNWKYEKYMSFLLPFMKDGQSMLPLVESFNAALDEGLTADHYDYEITAETIKVEDPRHEEIFFENGVNKNVQECAGQNAASSTNVTEVFSEQFTKRNSKRFTSTSGVVQQTQESTSAASTKLPINERQFMTYRTVYPTAPDPIDQFFSLMATTAKKFSAVDQHFLKSKIFNFVSSVEEKYLQQDQQNSVHIVYSTAQSSSPYSGVISTETTSAMSGESIPTSFQEIQCIQLNE